MPDYKVFFQPQNRTAHVERGESLLDATRKCNIMMNNLCGGDGICGRCKMIVKEGEISGEVSPRLSRQEIRRGYVLGCQAFVESDVVVEIPEETWAREKTIADQDAKRFSNIGNETKVDMGDKNLPVVER